MKPYINEIRKTTQIDSPLLKYCFNITSQNGEDGIIEHIFSLLPSEENR